MSIMPIKDVEVELDTLEMASRVTYLYEGKLILISDVPHPLLVLLKSVIKSFDMCYVICDKEVYIDDNGPVSRDLIEPRIQPHVILDRVNDAYGNSRKLRSLCNNCIIQLQTPDRPSLYNEGVMWEYVQYYCKLFYGCRVFKYMDCDKTEQYFYLEDFVQKMYSQSDEDNIKLCKMIKCDICGIINPLNLEVKLVSDVLKGDIRIHILMYNNGKIMPGYAIPQKYMDKIESVKNEIEVKYLCRPVNQDILGLELVRLSDKVTRELRML